MSGHKTQSPPHDLDAERIILGNCLITGEAAPLGELTPAEFFSGNNQAVARAIHTLAGRGEPVDIVMVPRWLEANGNSVPPSYVAGLVDALPHIQHPEFYRRRIRETAQLRQIAKDAYELGEDVLKGKPLEEVRQRIERLSAHGPNPRVGVWAEKKLKFFTGIDLGEESREPAEYLFGKLAVRGAITELHAKIKKGKTSLFLQGAKAMLEGRDFLGLCRPPIPAVVYLTEQPRASFREQVEKAGLLFRPNLHILCWAETFGTPWPLVAHAALQKCKEVDAPFLVIDTTHPFFQRSGVSENDAEAAIENMRPLQEIAADGIAVLCGRHERKSSGELADSGRGSSAYGGAVDILISMGKPAGKHPETFRELNCVSRFSETPTTMILDFDPETNLYKPLGTSEAVEQERAKKELLAALPSCEGDALSLTEITEELSIPRSTCQRAIEALCAEGGVSHSGEGKRRNPFRYWNPKKVSAQTSTPYGQDEFRTNA